VHRGGDPDGPPVLSLHGVGNTGRMWNGHVIVMHPHAAPGAPTALNRLALSDRLAWLAAVLTVLAAGAGIVVPSLYRDAPFWVEQARGTDVATLLLAVPILVVGLLAARRDVAGRLAVISVQLYLVYNYAIFSFAVAMNPLTVVYIALLGLAVWSLLLTLSAIDPDAIARTMTTRVLRRTSVAVLVAVAVLFGFMWLGQIAQAAVSGELPPDVARAGLATNPVYALDLALFLPACLLAAAGLLRRTWAGAFAVPMLVWLFLTSAGIVVAFVFAAQGGAPFAMGPAVMVGAIGVITAALALVAVVRRGS